MRQQKLALAFLYPKYYRSDMTEPLYSIGTYDHEECAYSRHKDLPAFNLTRKELVDVMRALQHDGYSCHRFRHRDPKTGELEEWASESDPDVLIERTDGEPVESILERWKR